MTAGNVSASRNYQTIAGWAQKDSPETDAHGHPQQKEANPADNRLPGRLAKEAETLINRAPYQGRRDDFAAGHRAY